MLSLLIKYYNEILTFESHLTSSNLLTSTYCSAILWPFIYFANPLKLNHEYSIGTLLYQADPSKEIKNKNNEKNENLWYSEDDKEFLTALNKLCTPDLTKILEDAVNNVSTPESNYSLNDILDVYDTKMYLEYLKSPIHQVNLLSYEKSLHPYFPSDGGVVLVKENHSQKPITKRVHNFRKSSQRQLTKSLIKTLPKRVLKRLNLYNLRIVLIKK